MASFKVTNSALRNGLRISLLLVILYLLIMELSRYRKPSFNKIKEQPSKNGGIINGIFRNQIGAKDLTYKITDMNDLNFSVKTHTNSGHETIITQREDSLDYKAEMNKLNEEKVAADDPRLIDLIRNYYILLPSTLEYNLTIPDRIDPSAGQAPFVDNRLNYTEGGFFVECGGLDGEKGSNTLLFERYRKWNGVLIEADPLNFKKLVRKHRKAYAINACLNIHPYPSVLTFQQASNVGKIVEGQATGKSTQVQCFPLYSILLALNQLTVDFLSLDVEGFELKVLQTIPFDKVDIRMMTVEYGHQKTGIRALQNFVEGKGYETLLKMSRDTWSVNDLIFRKKGMTN